MIKESIKILFLIILLNFTFSTAKSQVENVPVSHPIYSFLDKAVVKGLLPHTTLSYLPLQRIEIIKAIKTLNANKNELSTSEQKVLERFYSEFFVDNNTVVFSSPSDSTQIFFNNIFSEKEKYFYKYKDSLNNISISPLASVDLMSYKGDKASIASAGLRMYGSLQGGFGYMLQVTNGSLLSGNREVALLDPHYAQNIKFTKLKSDIDITESQVALNSNWFTVALGRETRLEGAGLNQKIFVANTSPAFDALTFTARFSNFEYQHTFASLLGIPENINRAVGFYTVIEPKYMIMHRFTLKPEWGEVSFVEQIITSRTLDLAYVTPLSFFKSLEHAQRDRDNSLMGLSFNVRPFNGFQISGSYNLDDIIFSKIGTGYWSNKSVWNIALQKDLPAGFDVGVEYSRIEPYTYTHFNVQNSYTNDSLQLGSYLKPNSDIVSFRTRYFWGQRIPITLNVSYTRHGDNVYQGDSLVKNVGGDIFRTRRPIIDEGPVTFLDGIRTEVLSIDLSAGYEIVRGLSLNVLYRIINEKDKDTNHFIRLLLKLGDF